MECKTREFKVKAYAQDALSQAKRSKYQDMIEGQMAAKDILTTIQGADRCRPIYMDPDELPSSDEELSLYMNLTINLQLRLQKKKQLTLCFQKIIMMIFVNK